MKTFGAIARIKLASGFLLLPLCFWLFAGCQGSKAKPLVIFAAASTQEPLREIAQSFQTDTGIPVELSFEASSTLARQIDKGAHADLFLSADEDWASFLEKRGLVELKHDYLSNKLVVIVPVDSGLSLTTLSDLVSPQIHHVALAGEVVPAGRYARDSLRHANAWERLKDRVLNADNVTAAVRYVAKAEAEAGIVYATDALGNSKVQSILTIPDDFHQPIRYPLVKIRQDSPGPGRDRLYDYLLSDAAKEIFRHAGFGILP
ncbi:MAG: molybdate ABC transporter substrate-binding protein [Gemmataceae bacterium]